MSLVMRFKAGTKVYVKEVYSGGNFEVGDVVTIIQVGDNDGDNECYGAVSPHDNLVWYLREGEVEAATNADKIRSMSDEKLAEFLDMVTKDTCSTCCSNFHKCLRNNAPEPECKQHYLEWLQEPMKLEAKE